MERSANSFNKKKGFLILPLIVFRFLMSVLIEGQAIMCKKIFLDRNTMRHLGIIWKTKTKKTIHIWRGMPGLGITYGTCSLREDPLIDPNIPLEKMIPTLSWQTPTRNSQREGLSLPRQGWDHLSQWDVGISFGFFTETTGSLHNPETRCTPSYSNRT